jgi:hypothetical protein
MHMYRGCLLGFIANECHRPQVIKEAKRLLLITRDGTAKDNRILAGRYREAPPCQSRRNASSGAEWLSSRHQHLDDTENERLADPGVIEDVGRVRRTGLSGAEALAFRQALDRFVLDVELVQRGAEQAHHVVVVDLSVIVPLVGLRRENEPSSGTPRPGPAALQQRNQCIPGCTLHGDANDHASLLQRDRLLPQSVRIRA